MGCGQHTVGGRSRFVACLTGRFDFTIHRLDNPRDVDGKPISDPQPADFWDISATGLELKRVKLPSQNLVIDHIERPSAN